MKILRNFGDFLVNIRYYIAKFLMYLMPKKETEPVTRTFNWDTLWQMLKIRHIVIAFIDLVLTIAITVFLSDKVPFLGNSLLSLTAKGICILISPVVKNPDPTSFFVIIPAALLLFAGKKRMSEFMNAKVVNSSNLPKWAMTEEIVFREGAEKWNFFEKLRSSLAFGFMHFTNVIYPLSVCVAISLGGLFYTLVYDFTFKATGSERLALRETATIHTVYNVFALILLVVTLIALAVYLLLGR